MYAPVVASDWTDSDATRSSCSFVSKVPQRVARSASSSDAVGMASAFAVAA